MADPTVSRTAKRGMRMLSLMALIALVATLLSPLARADQVQNDVTIGGTDTFVAGGSTVINYRVIGNNAGGDQPGCNASDGTPTSINIAVPAGVTASPNPRVITACNPTIFPVTFTSTVPGNYSITHTITDGEAGDLYNNQANFTLNVTSANTPPVAVNDLATVNEDSFVDINVLGNDTDANSNPLTVASASITAPAHGSVVLNADNTIKYTPNANYNGPDSFTYKAFDGTVASTNAATVSITVNVVNDPPTAANDSASTSEDTPVTVNVLANDTDIDSATLSVVGGTISDPVNGSAVVDGTGIKYTPDANFDGTDTFTYQVTDGTAQSNTATVTVSVSEVNDAPAASDQNVTTNEDEAVDFTLGASDAENDALTFTVLTDPLHGDLTGSAPTLTYTPDSNFNGTDSFTFKANDGNADSNTATVHITVSTVNDAPEAADDNATVAEDESVNINVLVNDSDVDGDTLTVTPGSADHGSVELNLDNTIKYSPNTNYNGPDSFSYTVSDGNGGSDTATVSINVTPVNDAPVADDDEATPNEDTPVDIDVVNGDTDVDGDSLSVVDVSISDPEHGSAALNPNGTIKYTPDENYNGSDSFTYRVSDGTTESNEATVTITITAVNDAPVADDQEVETDEDLARAITLTASDVDSVGLNFEVGSGPSYGDLSGTAPNLTYTPDANFFGSDSFTFKASDGSLSSIEATVTITVNSVNDIPVADAGGDYSGDEGSAINLDGSGSHDVEDNSLTYEWTADAGCSFDDSSKQKPKLTCNDDGQHTVTLKVTDDDGAHGSDSASVDVQNVVPTALTASFGNVPANCSVGGSSNVTLSGSFVGANVDSFTVVINWGDGSPSTTINIGAAASHSYSASHVYSTAGNHSANVTVTDDDGSQDSKPATIYVNYNVSGVLPPINASGTSVFNAKSTIPVKVQVWDCNGASVGNLTLVVQAYIVSTSTPTGPVNEELVSTSAANTGNTMRYDSSGQQYIFNLAASQLSDKDAKYQVWISINGTTQVIKSPTFGLKSK